MNDSWLVPLLAKRTPDCIRILMDLIEAGLRQGHASANDIREVQLAQPNAIGACFKLLHKFGFDYQGEHTYTTAKRKHRREIKIWRLVNTTMAETAVAHLRSMLINARPTDPQRSLPL